MVIRWATRLLYVMLFISFLVACGYWNVLITYFFIGSIVCLILPVLFFLNDDLEEIESDSLTKETP